MPTIRHSNPKCSAAVPLAGPRARARAGARARTCGGGCRRNDGRRHGSPKARALTSSPMLCKSWGAPPQNSSMQRCPLHPPPRAWSAPECGAGARHAQCAWPAPGTTTGAQCVWSTSTRPMQAAPTAKARSLRCAGKEPSEDRRPTRDRRRRRILCFDVTSSAPGNRRRRHYLRVRRTTSVEGCATSQAHSKDRLLRSCFCKPASERMCARRL